MGSLLRIQRRLCAGVLRLGALVLSAILVLPVATGATLDAQQLRGMVIDSLGRPLPDATARLLRSGDVTRTGERGEFTLRSSVSGPDTLLVVLVGWQPARVLFEFSGRTDLNWSVTLSRLPSVLDTVVATAERRCPMFTYAAFTCRSRSSVGYKRSAAELAALRPRYWADLFDGLPGVRRISNGAGDFTVEPTTGWRCLVELLNGRPLGQTGRVYFTPDVVIGMEYYPSYQEVPDVYRRYAWQSLRIPPGSISSFTGTCGVVVYWVKGVPMSDTTGVREPGHEPGSW